MSNSDGGPFMSADEYGRTLAALHQTEDYAALERDGATIQLHADRTYGRQPWGSRLGETGKRGFGVEIRLLGIDPDEAERRARAAGHAVLAPAKDWPPHGWRDCLLEDPDGYTFSVGTLLGK
jgi:hypothetical protein